MDPAQIVPTGEVRFGSTLAVFCRGRDLARISRKFQQSRSRNTLVANLVAAEF